jgi:hypothetical protein
VKSETGCLVSPAPALLFLLLAACASGPGTVCEPGERATIVDTLYFGSQYSDGVVTRVQWQEFVDRVVTPRFPEGLTVWRAAGQYRTAAGVIQHEPAWVLQLVHADTSATEAAIREIRASYQTQFKQEAVLRVRSKACVSF